MDSWVDILPESSHTRYYMKPDRLPLLQGTLDLLILRSLLPGPTHGHAIAKHIQRTTNDFLQMQHGSLYPALHQLEKKGEIKSEWRTAKNGRERKYYSLTPKGRKTAAAYEKQWRHLTGAMATILGSK